MGAVTPLWAVVVGSALFLALACIARAFALSRMALDRDAEVNIEIRVFSIFHLVLQSKQRDMEANTPEELTHGHPGPTPRSVETD
jgi:hypothetical protein